MKRLGILFLAAVLAVATAGLAPASMHTSATVKKAIVLAVFGTTVPAALKSILSLQSKMAQAFPDMPVSLAFTSEIVRAKWAGRAQDAAWRRQHPEVPDALYTVKNPLATIANLQDQGYRYIAVQSTHIFPGEEYENLKSEIDALAAIRTLRDRDRPFRKIVLGRPALGAPGDRHPYSEDIAHAALVLEADIALARKNRSALVYMGHGNEVFSTGVYMELEAALRDSAPEVPVFVGVVEGFPPLERVIDALTHAKVKTVTLFPLMVVAGDHAANDMAGAEDDSWKTRIQAKGITVTPMLRGLGEVDAWADIYVQHLKDAMKDEGF
ncbi:MAG: sirohydrochlorin cobaltochelatase [Pseudomonadota bacterium]